MLRGAAGAIVVATGLAATALGATAIRDKNAKHSDSAVSAATQGPVHVSADSTRATPDSATRTSVPGAAPVAAAPAAESPPAAKPAGPTPIIDMGSSSIAAGISAERTDTAVMVMFDTPMMRTRRPEKFEQVVRTTLPTIYGKKVDSLLTAMPVGSLAKQGDLLTDLSSRGMRIPVDSVWEIRVFPETRKGQEGPLVVRYRAAAVAR